MIELSKQYMVKLSKKKYAKLWISTVVPPFVKSKKILSSKKKEFNCGDTINTPGHEDQEFQWSRAYNYYKSLSPIEKKMNLIWTSGITLAGCVPEVTEFKEIVQWCVDNFIFEWKIIQLEGHQPISLAPSTFSEMLRLSTPTMRFKNE